MALGDKMQSRRGVLFFAAERNIIMRLTILKSLVIFFVGFAAAIYVVAPEPNTETMRAEKFANKANEATRHLISTIREKF